MATFGHWVALIKLYQKLGYYNDPQKERNIRVEIEISCLTHPKLQKSHSIKLSPREMPKR